MKKKSIISYSIALIKSDKFSLPKSSNGWYFFLNQGVKGSFNKPINIKILTSLEQVVFNLNDENIEISLQQTFINLLMKELIHLILRKRFKAMTLKSFKKYHHKLILILIKRLNHHFKNEFHLSTKKMFLLLIMLHSLDR